MPILRAMNTIRRFFEEITIAELSALQPEELFELAALVSEIK